MMSHFLLTWHATQALTLSSSSSFSFLTPLYTNKLLILISFLISIPLNVISQSTELKTLLNIKQQLGNPPPIQSWNATSWPCSWPEITCTGGSVTGISLRDMDITVEIPPSICNLKNLTAVDFAWNYIPGDFPKFLYNCSKLQYLDLSENFFVGLIPGDIDRLSTLLYLDLRGNNYTRDIPPVIGNLTDLQYLFLNNNEFNNTFPAEIWKLIQKESLQRNYLKGVVTEKLPKIISHNRYAAPLPSFFSLLVFCFSAFLCSLLGVDFVVF